MVGWFGYEVLEDSAVRARAAELLGRVIAGTEARARLGLESEICSPCSISLPAADARERVLSEDITTSILGVVEEALRYRGVVSLLASCGADPS